MILFKNALGISGVAILAIFFLYCIYVSLFFAFQRRMLFHPNYRNPLFDKCESPPPSTERSFLCSPKWQIEIWFLPPTRPTYPKMPAIIFAHGDGGSIDHWPHALTEFNRMGFGVFLPELPGYGRSIGHPSQSVFTEAMCSAYDFVEARKDVDKEKIVFVGNSLGTGAICALAEKRPSAAIILVSAFTSRRSFASSRYCVPGFLVRDGFDNLSTLKSYTKPVMLIHGTNDYIIPISHAMKLEEASSNAILITHENGHHFPGRWKNGQNPPGLWPEIESFLLQSGIIRSGSGGEVA